MAALGDYLTAIATRIVNLHLANAAWAAAVRPGNRIARLPTSTPWPKPAGARRGDADAVEWDFRWVRWSSTPGVRNQVTFCGNGIVYRTYVGEITMKARDTRQDALTALESLTEQILTAAGPHLSLSGSPLPYVSAWGPLSGTFEEKSTQTDSTLRAYEHIQLPVGVALPSGTITG